MAGNRGAGTAYAQVAAAIRARIMTGELAVGQRIPSQPDIVAQYRVSKTTAENAVRILEAEGLVVRRVGVGTFVIASHELETVHAGPGTRVTARMPGRGEDTGVPPGVPLLEVTGPDGPARLYAADRTIIVITGQ